MSELSFRRAIGLLVILGPVGVIALPAQDQQRSSDSVTFNNLFSLNGADGSEPLAGLVQATDGNFYGTTETGGPSKAVCYVGSCGTVFKITPGGTLTVLHNFDGTDGEYPYAGLVQAANGDFYGTTNYGGANSDGGTVFKITATGTLTTLYSFCAQTNCTDGAAPYAGLVQASDGNFYGTTSGGGVYLEGTVFKITPTGTLTSLHSFDYTEGDGPEARLVQVTNGNFYGTTYLGGANGLGTIFSLSVGLGPFVETLPTSGAVGTKVTILGNNLAGTSSVTFNGIAVTSFTVNSTGTAITTTVPGGATTGYVQVTTPSGTLTSNLKFRVP